MSADIFKVNPDGWTTGSIPDAVDYATAYQAFGESEGKPDFYRLRDAIDAIWQRAVASGRELVALEAEHSVSLPEEPPAGAVVSSQKAMAAQ